MSLNFKYNLIGKKVIPENLRITCEYCGRTIDTSTDDHCPSCGAVYDANAHLQEHKRRQEELRKMKLERKQLEMEQQTGYVVDYKYLEHKGNTSYNPNKNFKCVFDGLYFAH